MATQTARTLLTKCYSIRPDFLLWPLKELTLYWPNVTTSCQIVMAVQTACTPLTKCHFIKPNCLLWPLKQLELFWTNVTSSGQIVCLDHSQSLYGSDQMLLHQARLSLMATERACSLLTSNQMSLHQAILLWPSQSLHSSDQMSLHQARLSVMATQRACTFLTKCCSIRPFCLSRPFKELVHFWNVISLLLSYATWVVRGGRNLQFSRYIPTYCSIWWFIHIIIFPVWSWDSLLVRARDSQSKGC